MTAADALDLGERLLTFGILLTAVEILVGREHLRPGGPLDWQVLSIRPRTNLADRLLGRRAIEWLLDVPGVFLLSAVSIAGAATMFAWPRLVVGPATCVVCLVILSRRHAGVLDGSDDMLTVVLGAALVRTLDHGETVQAATAAYLCAQVCLSYLTSGLSKAQCELWWNGKGLLGVLTTIAYSTPRVARLVVARPGITRFFGPATILWETAFVVAVLAGPGPAVAALLVAGGFHLTCAFVMGLPAFIWPFTATFPSVLWVSGRLGDHLTGGERALLATAVALPIASAAAYFGGAARRPPASRTAPRTTVGPVRELAARRPGG